MKINKVRLVNSNMSVAIDYADESGQEHLLILGAENVVKNWQAVEHTLAPDACPVCHLAHSPNGVEGCGNSSCPSRAGKA